MNFKYKCVANRRVKRKRLVFTHVHCQVSTTKMRRNETRPSHHFADQSYLNTCVIYIFQVLCLVNCATTLNK